MKEGRRKGGKEGRREVQGRGIKCNVIEIIRLSVPTICLYYVFIEYTKHKTNCTSSFLQCKQCCRNYLFGRERREERSGGSVI